MNRADGSGLVYAYDALGRLTWYGTSTQGRGYSYDWCGNGKGRLCEATTGAVARHYGYTPQGQVAVTRDFTAGMVTDDWTGYNYDGMGRLTGMSYPSGVVVGYGYSNGKLSLMNLTTASGVSQVVASGIQYRPYGPATNWTYGNGLTRNLYHDQNMVAGDQRLTGLTTMDGGGTLQSLLMEYSVNDEIAKITNYVTTDMTQTYGFDALSRLTSITSPFANESIQYDANGNRTLHNWLAPISNQVDTSSNRILSDYVAGPSSGIVYSHDARGNRSSQSWNGSTASYTYDAFNSMSSVTRTAPSTYSNGGYVMTTYTAGTTTYKTNALDQRVAKTNATTNARYVYAGQNKLLAENNNGQWTTHLRLGGQPVGLVRNNTVYWSHTDHLGRPELVTNSAKQIVWRAKNFHSERGVSLDAIGGYHLGFPGQYYDSETGLWYNGFRYYDSRLGRYTQSDPIGLVGGINTYVYAGGNPISLVDPLGLEWTYYSATGDLYQDGTLVATGYAGHGDGVNNPDMQNVSNVGLCGWKLYDWTSV